jgi:hypothetical protein
LEWQEYPIPADLSASPVSNVRRIRVFLVTVVKIGNASLVDLPLPTLQPSQFPTILPNPTPKPFLTSPFSPLALMDYTACSSEVSQQETPEAKSSPKRNLCRTEISAEDWFCSTSSIPHRIHPLKILPYPLQRLCSQANSSTQLFRVSWAKPATMRRS